jgi:hypothetical protein
VIPSLSHRKPDFCFSGTTLSSSNRTPIKDMFSLIVGISITLISETDFCRAFEVESSLHFRPHSCGMAEKKTKKNL